MFCKHINKCKKGRTKWINDSGLNQFLQTVSQVKFLSLSLVVQFDKLLNIMCLQSNLSLRKNVHYTINSLFDSNTQFTIKLFKTMVYWLQ